VHIAALQSCVASQPSIDLHGAIVEEVAVNRFIVDASTRSGARDITGGIW
jgi:hypothetical protein